MDQRKIFKILEVIWLVIALMAACICVYFIITGDKDSGIFFFFFFLIGGIMFMLRRYQRKKQETRQQKPSEKP